MVSKEGFLEATGKEGLTWTDKVKEAESNGKVEGFASLLELLDYRNKGLLDTNISKGTNL